MPIKHSDAQPLVKYVKQLHKEENKKSGTVMQYPIDSYFCGINRSSESFLIMSFLLSQIMNTFLSDSGAPSLRGEK